MVSITTDTLKKVPPQMTRKFDHRLSSLVVWAPDLLLLRYHNKDTYLDFFRIVQEEALMRLVNAFVWRCEEFRVWVLLHFMPRRS
jgi:hypothetical protein